MSERAALVLGASSGFGAAACRAFAAAGYDIYGVHLDRASTMPQAEAVQADVEAAGVSCRFFNVNAADAGARAEVLDAIAEGPTVRVLLHSLAFGSLAPLLGRGETKAITERQMSMTLDVMAHSLVWWSRDLVSRGLMGEGGRIFSMTSSGSHTALPDYGAVGAAKSALETHTRYLAMEMAPLGITANAILAGVTDTPALRKIPRWEEMVETATRRNPSGRLTRPEDVAVCLVALSEPGTGWMTGNTLRVDGGEDICA